MRVGFPTPDVASVSGVPDHGLAARATAPDMHVDAVLGFDPTFMTFDPNIMRPWDQVVPPGQN